MTIVGFNLTRDLYLDPSEGMDKIILSDKKNQISKNVLVIFGMYSKPGKLDASSVFSYVHAFIALSGNSFKNICHLYQEDRKVE